MLLEFKNLSIGYNIPLIENINTTLQQGDICLMIGNNGVGKTTLIRSIFKQVKPITGDILLDGTSTYHLTEKDIATKISVVFSKSFLPDNYTTKELISLGKFIHYPYYFELNKKDKQQIKDTIIMFGLEQYTNIPIRKLSDGNLQKAFIARALIQNSPMIILDEPTTYLDERNKKEILNLLRYLAKEHQKIILFSSHDWRLAKDFADKIWLIKDKKLHFGLAEDIIHQFNLLSTSTLISENFVAPKIIAPANEKMLLISLLQKNFNIDLSLLSIELINNYWIISSHNKTIKVYSFQEILDVIREIF